MSDGHDDDSRLAAIMNELDQMLAEEDLSYSRTLTVIEMLVATIVAANTNGNPQRFKTDIERFCEFLRQVEITPLGDGEYAVGNRRRRGDGREEPEH